MPRSPASFLRSSCATLRATAVCGVAAAMMALPLHAQTLATTALAPIPIYLSSPLAESREQAVRCLIDAIVYEAAREPLEGQQAVAQVIMNRTRAAIFPTKVCGVIYQGSERRTGCQFTFTCDGSLRRRVPLSYFEAARPIAEAAMDGALPDRVGQALFYHAHYVLPKWAPRLDRVAQIGAHIFYRQPGTLLAQAIARPAFGPTPRPDSVAPSRPFAPWGLSVEMEATRQKRVN